MRFALGKSYGDLVLLGHRLYDPQAARFLAPDPIHQIVNQYAYAQGNPVELWDPGGLAANVGPAANPGVSFLVVGSFFVAISPIAAGIGLRFVFVPGTQAFGGGLLVIAIPLHVTGQLLVRLGNQLLLDGLPGLPEMTNPIAPPRPDRPAPPGPPGEDAFALPVAFVPSCAPATLAHTPHNERVLMVLIPLQIALALLLMRRRRQWLRRQGETQ